MPFKPKYDFAAMAVGDAFEFDVSDEKGPRGVPRDILRVRQAAAQWKRRHPGWDYEVRSLSGDKAMCRRIA